MRSETTAILNMADAIPGYSRQQLLADLEPLVNRERFYTIKEVCERYEVTAQTLKNWEIAKRLIPDLRVGDGCVRYSATLLAEFENKNRGNKE